MAGWWYIPAKTIVRKWFQWVDAQKKIQKCLIMPLAVHHDMPVPSLFQTWKPTMPLSILLCWGTHLFATVDKLSATVDKLSALVGAFSETHITRYTNAINAVISSTRSEYWSTSPVASINPRNAAVRNIICRSPSPTGVLRFADILVVSQLWLTDTKQRKLGVYAKYVLDYIHIT